MKLDGLMLTKKRFTKMVEETVRDKNMSYIDSIVYLCDQIGMDVEDSKKFIHPSILSKVEYEAQTLNYLPKKNSLPLD